MKNKLGGIRWKTKCRAFGWWGLSVLAVSGLATFGWVLVGLSPVNGDAASTTLSTGPVEVVGEDYTVELSAEPARGNALFVARNERGELIGGATFISGWQSYCGVERGRIHMWVRSAGAVARVDRLKVETPDVRTGYGFVAKDQLVLWDRATDERFQLGEAPPDQAVSSEMKNDLECPPFVTAKYSFKQESSRVAACEQAEGGNCLSVDIAPGSWPYVFAERDGAVVAVTNFGEALLFKSDRWCRMRKSGDKYHCSLIEPAMLESPRKVQFYSSLEYGGKTLLGEWPTGRLYEFDGVSLMPASISPPSFSSDKALGYEAQSVAEYCGSLYVGYWPRGEVWKRSKSGTWRMWHRFFSHPTDVPMDDAIIPYQNRPADDFESAFYGQRITSLVPHRDGLYVYTSNLSGWKATERQNFLTRSQEKEYGSVYRVHRPGCITVQSSPDKSIKFVGRRYRSNKTGRDVRELVLYENDVVAAVSRAYTEAKESDGSIVE